MIIQYVYTFSVAVKDGNGFGYLISFTAENVAFVMTFRDRARCVQRVDMQQLVDEYNARSSLIDESHSSQR